MKLKGPLVTLAAGGVVAAGLLITNVSLSQRQSQNAASASVAVAATPSAPPSVTASPSATASASGAAAQVTTGTVTYAGKVDGGGSLSVVVKGAGAVAYLCDGRHEAWLWGQAAGSSLTLRNKAGDTLTGTRGGGRLTGSLIGSLTVHGTTWTFTLPTVRKPSGLYRATATVRGAKVVAGWVVLPDGSQVGAWTAGGADVRPAPPLDLAGGTATVDGVRLVASEPDAVAPRP